MEITLVAYGIARDILEGGEISLEVEDNTNIGNLKSTLINRFPRFEQLRGLRFAIREDYQDDSYLLKPEDEVVIIPPVSGG